MSLHSIASQREDGFHNRRDENHRGRGDEGHRGRDDRLILSAYLADYLVLCCERINYHLSSNFVFTDEIVVAVGLQLSEKTYQKVDISLLILEVPIFQGPG